MSLIEQRKLAHIFKRNAERNRLLTCRIQQTSQINYCRFLATRAFNFFRENYDFSPDLVSELQKILDAHFEKIPYGWEIPQIDAGITRMIETFIQNRNIHRHGTNHISI